MRLQWFRFTIESASSSSRSDLEPDFGAGEEKADSYSESELESYSPKSWEGCDSFVVLMSDSFEVISLPADMLQVLQQLHIFLPMLTSCAGIKFLSQICSICTQYSFKYHITFNNTLYNIYSLWYIIFKCNVKAKQVISVQPLNNFYPVTSVPTNLLCTVRVARYGPRASCQREGWNLFPKYLLMLNVISINSIPVSNVKQTFRVIQKPAFVSFKRHLQPNVCSINFCPGVERWNSLAFCATCFLIGRCQR